MEISYRLLSKKELSSDWLMSFCHDQHITARYIKQGQQWLIQPCSINRQWDKEKRQWIPTYLARQIDRHGYVIGAYHHETCIGFIALDGCLKGSKNQYANLTMLFVDDGWQGHGIGESLFSLIQPYARQLGAQKLFISAIPSVETVDFYFHRGCWDAKEIIPSYIDSTEDRYLEYDLKNAYPD